jgi:crotonobetainyl-CoA:carnitine CoA-transferase CaiB-like acyl-CoA transferase
MAPTARRILIVTAGNNGLLEKLLAVVGHPEWLADPRFHTNGDRVRNRAAFDELLNAALSVHTTAEWIPLIEAVGVPCAPIQTMGQVIAHPQTQALDIIRCSDDGALAFFGLPLSFDGVRPGRNEPVPELGAHTSEIFGK